MERNHSFVQTVHDHMPLGIQKKFQHMYVEQWYTRSRNFWPKRKVFSFRFRPPKLKAEYDRNSRKALDFLLFVNENIANVNYQW